MNKLEDFIYKRITNWFIKLTNKRNHNLNLMKGDYDVVINSDFEGCTYGICQPIECIYFALLEVYGHIDRLRIQGITMDYSDNNVIKINIMSAYPGLIIGRYGKPIEQLHSTLYKYFGKKVNINLVEVKMEIARMIY